jgi:hypothetical protein
MEYLKTYKNLLKERNFEEQKDHWVLGLNLMTVIKSINTSSSVTFFGKEIHCRSKFSNSVQDCLFISPKLH